MKSHLWLPTVLILAVPIWSLTSSCNPSNGGNDATTDADAGETETGTTCNPENLRGFSGTLRLHPTTKALDSSANLGDARLSLISAGAAISGADFTPLPDADCNPVTKTYPTDLDTSEASWSFDQVDVSSIALGIVSLVRSPEQAEDSKFLSTATGIAAPPFDEDVSDRPAFVLTNQTEAKLAELLATKSEKFEGPGDLEASGFLILQFFQSGNPAAGITVTRDGHAVGDRSADASGDRVKNAYYPSNDYSSVEKGPWATTSDNGIAILPDARLAAYTGVHVMNDVKFTSVDAAGNIEGIAFTDIRVPQND